MGRRCRHLLFASSAAMGIHSAWCVERINQSDSTTVATWPASGTNAFSATQSSESLKPLYMKTEGPNGLPTVKFDGTDDWMEHAVDRGEGTCTVLLVAKTHATPSGWMNIVNFCHTSSLEYNAITASIGMPGGGFWLGPVDEVGMGVMYYTATARSFVSSNTEWRIYAAVNDGTDRIMRVNGLVTDSEAVAYGSSGSYVSGRALLGSSAKTDGYCPALISAAAIATSTLSGPMIKRGVHAMALSYKIASS
jgi:hypothetical protein